MFETNSLKSNAGKTADEREGASVTQLQNREGPATMAMIGPSIHIKGDVIGEESLVIQGQVEGSVTLKQNNLIIGQEGKVTATVHGQTITIEGTLKGDVFGNERVIIKKTGDIRGNISAPQVSMEEGAKFKGSMDMDYKPVVTAALRKEPEPVSVLKFDASVSSDKPPVGSDKPPIGQTGDVK
ncbi:MAG: polymer-forming cytoskeletal protein [Gammaproteobacteria bacterium]|jgi:cytoskeletal protein CcmA (bactofilin family)